MKPSPPGSVPPAIIKNNYTIFLHNREMMISVNNATDKQDSFSAVICFAMPIDGMEAICPQLNSDFEGFSWSEHPGQS